VASLNYNHLRYFRAIAHEGNLTRAAERLHVSASALSTQLRALEAQLGQPLFDRQNKRLTLTEAGRIALEHADAIFRTGDELLGTLQGRGTASRQVLRVGALATLSRNFQIGLLRKFVGRTDIELVVRSGSMRDLLAQLDTLALDVVLSNQLPPADAETHRISAGRRGASASGFRKTCVTRPSCCRA
jgi:LysR family transcriptional regulator, transcriptional activator of nhaA